MLDVKIHLFFMIALFSLALSACKLSEVSQTIPPVVTTATTSSTSARFAGGSKAFKIITSNAGGTGSFSSFISGGTVIPTTISVPIGYPGYAVGATYLPGVSANQYFDVDGTTVISKPSWLYDVQLGVTTNNPASACATFGGGSTYDISNFYRVSEANCGAAANGTGGNTDPVFMRVVLNRDTSVLGSGENLLIQVEYQASGIRLNSDGVSLNPENNVDQLWKVFWKNSLASTSLAKIFSVFIPPNYGACASGGTYTAGAPGSCTGTYSGAPTTIKQIIVPISAYSSLGVIEISRVTGRIKNTSFFDPPGNTQPVNYVNAYLGGTAACLNDSPLCLGLVVRSIMMMRI